MQLIKEGKVSLYIHSGKITKKLPVFYNPEMKEHRDITISVLNAYFNKKFLACDPLAGSGVRGLRIKKETKGDVVLNDINSDAVRLIRKNSKLNNIKMKVYNKDAKVFLLENKFGFDFIDIDPFGSPTKFFEPSCVAIKSNGLIGVTATDTGALAGSFKEACLRRYGVNVCRTDFFKELGIRVLITSIQKSFAKYDISFLPLLNFSNHFFRVFGKIERGKQKADSNLKQIDFVSYCSKCLYRNVGFENCLCKSTKVIGPLWLGKIQDKNFIQKVNKKGSRKFIEEIDDPFYFNVHKLCKTERIESPKIENILDKLQKNGFRVSRSNLCPTGIKTNADLKSVLKCLS